MCPKFCDTYIPEIFHLSIVLLKESYLHTWHNVYINIIPRILLCNNCVVKLHTEKYFSYTCRTRMIFFTYVVLIVVINHYTDHRGGIFCFEPKQCRNVIWNLLFGYYHRGFMTSIKFNIKMYASKKILAANKNRPNKIGLVKK